MRSTLGSVKDRIGKILNICPDDDRVKEYLNLAVQMLRPKGKWVGTVQRYRIQAIDACITWPRNIETIEAWALDRIPGSIRNGWFEFVANGPGKLSKDDYAGYTLIDRGESCTFDVPRGTDKYIQFYCDLSADAGKTVMIQYFDGNGNKVYTAGVEGEYITLVSPVLPNPYAQSASQVMPNGLYAVIKPVTLGVIRAYVYDNVTGIRYPIGYYEPSETLPSYRNSIIPDLPNIVCTTGSCINVMAKMAYVPVTTDTDFLLIANPLALEYAVQALRFKENSDGIQQGVAYEAMAVQTLQDELDSWMGDGAVPVVKSESRRTWGGGGVDNWN